MSYLLNRRNTITGVRYGDDPTVLAWETGNEMQHNFIGEPFTGINKLGLIVA